MSDTKRAWGDRPDAKWLRDLDPMHIFMSYILPNRCDNEAYIKETVDLTNATAYLAQKNAAHPEDHYTLFHLILAALNKTIALRPKMNRFMKGGRVYQRNDISMAFVVKKQFQDDAHEALAILHFEETDTLDSIHERLMNEIHACRGDRLDPATDIMAKLVKLPRPILSFVGWLLRTLDQYGKLPTDIRVADPYHSTVFITNLGSIGMEAGYHHLANWGTNSIFVVVGKKRLAPVYRDDGTYDMHEVVDIGLTLDERIADGYYYSGTVKLLTALLRHPEALDLPAKEPFEV